MPQQTRRNFLGETGTWLGLGSLAGLSGMPYLNADEGDSLSIALSSEIEPLVRLIEDTPREKSIAMMIGELRRGTTLPEDLVQQIFQMQPKRRHDESQKEILVGREGPREDQDKVAELAFSYASKYPDHRDYFQAARLLTAMKSTQDAHDVKFPVAIFENHGLVNPKWRPHLIAASSHYMHGTQMKDNPAVRMAKDQLS